MRSRAALGVDTGGTFTDFVLIDEQGLRVHKLPSTPDDPAGAILRGVTELGLGPPSGAEEEPVPAGSAPGCQPRPFRTVHGTTVGTNALLERKGARTAFVTTKGFRDLLAIGRQTRLELYSLAPTKPQPVVDERDCYEVEERIDPWGRVLRALDPAEAEAVMERVARSGAKAVAVTLLFSFVNPEHEHHLGCLAERQGLYASLSSRIAPEHREYERASTTALNAYVGPVVAPYLERLAAELATQECERLQVMQSNGGVISTATACREPVRTLLSGPAGGVVGAVRLAAAARERCVLTLDIGGTSTDVCLVRGEPPLAAAGEIGHLPVRLPMIDIHTIGAGGGSIARAAAGGALRVGPESAGAVPGPAAYGRGDQPTVTDANIVLGRLPPESFLGGRMALYPERSEAALARLGGTLGLSIEAAAEGIVRVANVQMARALRRVSVERGHDPRGGALVPYGGGGPLHACELAELMGIRRVLVPPYPGALSALGLLMSDVIKDYARTLMRPTASLAPGEIEALFGELERQAAADMRAEGVAPADAALRRSFDMRYRGQSYELTLPAAPLDGLEAAFHAAHAALYGHGSPGQPTEVVQVRVQSVGRTARPAPEVAADPAPRRPPTPIGRRRIRFREWLDTRVYRRANLLPGDQFDGPALVLQVDTTTLVPPDWSASVDGAGNLRLSQA